jgi:hypothetical protein
MLTAILKIKTTLPAVVAECLATFGEGARQQYNADEEAFALFGTPVQFGYTRVIVAPHIATALQWMQDTGVESPNVEIARVEWEGQDIVGGEDQPFQVGTQNVTDEQGNVIATQPVYLGRMC